MILRYQLFIAVLAFCGLFSMKTTKRFHISAALLLAWVLISATLTAFQPFYTQDLLSLRLRLVSARSFIVVTMLVFGVWTLDYWRTFKWLEIMKWFAVVDAIIVLILLHWFPQGAGIFNAGSMDTTFIALCLPLYFYRQPTFEESNAKSILVWGACFSVSVLAIILTPGSTAYLVLFFSLLSYFVLTRKWAAAIGSICLVVSIGLATQGKDIANDSGRLGPWKTFMSWWWDGPPANWKSQEAILQDGWNNIMAWRVEHSPVLTGTGTGTFQWIGPAIQNTRDNIFIWMHNEYLQVAFEQGLIGLTLMLWVAGVCLWRVRKRPWLFATVVGILASFLTQFPLRYPLSQIFILLVARASLEKVDGES